MPVRHLATMMVHTAGPFIVWNEPNEAALLKRWFEHMQEVLHLLPESILCSLACHTSPMHKLHQAEFQLPRKT